jgi:hypothetical protein
MTILAITTRHALLSCIIHHRASNIAHIRGRLWDLVMPKSLMRLPSSQWVLCQKELIYLFIKLVKIWYLWRNRVPIKFQKGAL